jgi:hypothetical protein
MTKAEMIERLQELEQFLNRDAKDVAEQFNAEHPDWDYRMDTKGAYAYMVGWAYSAIKNILDN